MSVVHEVADLPGAVRMFEELLETAVRDRGPGWAAVDNGSLSIRLVAATRPAPGRLTLELVTDDLAATAAVLVDAGIRAEGAVTWAAADRQEQRFSTPHGMDLVLTRRWDEDQLGVVPALPIHLEWELSASETVQALLREIPLAFRQNARLRITRRAESLSLEAGEVEVTRFRGIQATVQATPAFQLDRLREAISSLGHDPSGWESDFER